MSDANHKEICITDSLSMSTTQREALAFITLTFIEDHARYEGAGGSDDNAAVTQSQWFISCLTLFFFSVHCLQSCFFFFFLKLMICFTFQKSKCYECRGV